MPTNKRKMNRASYSSSSESDTPDATEKVKHSELLTTAFAIVGEGVRRRRIALWPRSECTVSINGSGVDLERKDTTPFPCWSDDTRSDRFPDANKCVLSDGTSTYDVGPGDPKTFLVNWKGQISRA
jgi:hypothetical protein